MIAARPRATLSFLSAIGAVALAFAPLAPALAWVAVLSLALFAAVVLRLTPALTEPRLSLATQAVLGAGLASELFAHALRLPTSAALPAQLAGFRGLAVLAFLFASAYLCLHLRASLVRARFLSALACFAAMGAAALHLSPGQTAPRFALLAALVICAWLLGRVGAATAPELAALLLVFQPQTFFVLERGAPTPLGLSLWLLAASSTLRRWPSATAILSGAAAALCLAVPLVAGELGADTTWLGAALLCASAASWSASEASRPHEMLATRSGAR